MGAWSAPGTGEAVGGTGLAVYTARVLSLQQECLQLDRLKTQLSDAVQRYGGVQQVRLPRRVCGPAGAPRALWFPRRPSHPSVGLGWPGGGPVLESRGQSRGRAGPVDGRHRQLPQPQGMCRKDTHLWVLLRGPWRVGRAGTPRLTGDTETQGFHGGRGRRAPELKVGSAARPRPRP